MKYEFILLSVEEDKSYYRAHSRKDKRIEHCFHFKSLTVKNTVSEIFDNNGDVVAIHFKTVRQSGGNAKKSTRTKYTIDEIDYFSTSYQGKCFLVPVEQCSNDKTLRILPPKNGQVKGITWLKDCELSEVIKSL